MLNNRLKNLERQICGRSCAACADASHVFIDSARARERFDRQMREREQRCTCGRPFRVKVVTFVRDEVAA